MKKLILVLFALLFSIGPSFSYRIWSYAEVEGRWYYSCYGSDGSCLPTVIVAQ